MPCQGRGMSVLNVDVLSRCLVGARNPSAHTHVLDILYSACVHMYTDTYTFNIVNFDVHVYVCVLHTNTHTKHTHKCKLRSLAGGHAVAPGCLPPLGSELLRLVEVAVNADPRRVEIVIALALVAGGELVPVLAGHEQLAVAALLAAAGGTEACEQRVRIREIQVALYSCLHAVLLV